ncbi:MAG: hypothetical protein J1F10_00660 [Muribaculaceae bacterium]|nr:hypothetical protein [Muribaculaceae bacterium]
MNKLIIILSLAGIATSLTATAQDDNLNKEIVVEKDYTPIEQKASKLSLVPPVVQFEPAASNLTFSMRNSPVATGNQIPTLPAYGYLTQYVKTDPRGYLNFSMGSYFNINGAAGFNVIDTKKSKLAIFVGHASTAGANSDIRKYFPSYLVDNTQIPTIKQRWNDEHAGLNYRQKIGNLLLYSDATYSYSGTRAFSNTESSHSTIKGNDVDLKLGIDHISGAALSYNANITFNYFDYNVSNYTPAVKSAQTYLKLDGGVGSRVHDKYKAGIDLGFEYMSTNNNPNKTNIGLLKMTPYYGKLKGAFTYKLGLNLDMSFNDGRFFNVSPAVNAKYKFTNGFSVYGIATGGKHFNRMFDTASQNRYTLVYGLGNTSMTQVNAQVGFLVGPFNGFKMKIYGGYESVKNSNIPTNIQFKYNNISRTDLVMTLSEYGDYGTLDLSGFMWGADISYNYFNLVDFYFGIKNTHQNSEGSNYSFGYDRPEWVLDTRIGINPIPKLHIDLGYEWRGNRRIGAYYYNPQPVSSISTFQSKSRHFTCIDLLDVSNVWVRTSYRINYLLEVNLQATNLLNKGWHVMDIYSNQGIAIMGGIALQFK